MKRVFVAGVLALVLVSVFAELPTARAQSTVTVIILASATDPSEGPGYLPDVVTVVMGINNTVVWKNDDESAHTVTSIPGNGSLNSGDMSPGSTYNYTFTTPGTYEYHCTIHNWMFGDVVVKPSTTPVPEFPAASLALLLFAVVAAVVLVVRGRSTSV